MKKSDITRELGFIDPEFIAEAASYKPRKISKIRIVALAACIAVLVTAIPLTLILNRENGNTEDLPAITTKDNTVIDKPEPDKEEPLIIFCSSPNELKKQLKADANVEIKDVAERTYFDDPFSDTVVDKKAGTPYVKTITIGNETFEISYEESRASKTFESLSTHLKAYAGVDKYSTPHNNGIYWGKPTYEFSQETGKLTKYFKGSGFIKSGNLGEAELHKIALQEIYNLYGIDIAKDPNYRYECRLHPAVPQREEYYQIIYRRYINGYETDEKIYICLDTTGQIISISQNLGLYDEVAEMVTEQNINIATEKFTKLINDSTVFKDEISISIDNYGNCFAKFYIAILGNNVNYTYDTYIEVEITE